MSFGGPYSELNKRMKEFREETKNRREKRNQWREFAGISTASSDKKSDSMKFTEQDRQAFLKELKAEKFNNRVKNIFAILISVLIGLGIVWMLFINS